MNNDIILLAHGAGGKKSAELTKEIFLPHFGNSILNSLSDSAVLELETNKIATTTDAFVVQPLFFPHSDIGKLAVCGTINDLTAAGAKPLSLTAAFMIEEGLEIATLLEIVISMKKAAAEAGVCIVAGDTKVVSKGAVDQIFICTSGIGIYENNAIIPSSAQIKEGDSIILTGTIADHGMAVMTTREGIEFSTKITSDCAPLNNMVDLLKQSSIDVHCMRDPTRGGLAAVLNELAVQGGVCIEVDESKIPVNENVRAACEMLGIDPMYVANEGKMVIILPEKDAETALNILKSHKYGKESQIIGIVKEKPIGKVHLRTTVGSLRIMDMPSGDLLPRIC